MTTPSPRTILDAVPRRLRPRAALILGNRIGAALLRTAGESVRVQIFDRSMTLAAQAFTSIFPLLIMLGALFGDRARERLNDLVRLPEDSALLVHEALNGSRSNAFGVLGSLIVVLSATGLARALTRAYRTTWSIRGGRAGAAATGWQIGTVLLLVAFLIGARLLARLADLLPAPGIARTLLTLLADGVLAILLPRVLLGPVVPRDRLLLGGAVFGILMIGVRAGGAVFLPRALQSSTERYGTIGLAFTYIGWLYALSFCLLLAAVLGGVLAEMTGYRSDGRPRGFRTPRRHRPTEHEGQDDLGETDDQAAGAGEQDQQSQRQAGHEEEDRADHDGQRTDDQQRRPA
jgi:membrane protein